MAACQYRWEASLATLIPRYALHAANKTKIHRKCHFWSLRIDLGPRTRTEGHRYREEIIPSSRGKHWAFPEPCIRAHRLEFQKNFYFSDRAPEVSRTSDPGSTFDDSGKHVIIWL